MTDQYSLDVDPELLRITAKSLEELHRHLTTKGAEAARTPGEIGDSWTGDAAVKIKHEMGGVGHLMKQFAPKFHDSAAALRSLAHDYDHALTQVASLNRKYAAAQKSYKDACVTADHEYNKTVNNLRKSNPHHSMPNRGITYDLDQSRSNQKSQAYQDQQKTCHDLDYSFGMMKRWLAQQTAKAGKTISELVPTPVSHQQLVNWTHGKYPTRLSHPGLLAELSETAAKEKADIAAVEAARRKKAQTAAKGDIEKLNSLLHNGQIEDADAVKKQLELIGSKANDPYYAKALLQSLGPYGLNGIYNSLDNYCNANRGRDGSSAQDWKDALTKFNDTVAAGLHQYDDRDLVKFVNAAFGPTGGGPRIASALNSKYADARLNALGLQWLHRVTEFRLASDRTDVAEQVAASLGAGDTDGLAEKWASRTDSKTLHDLLAHIDPEQAKYIVQGLLADDWNTQSGPYHEDTWKLKAGLVEGALDQALDEHDVALTQLFLSNLPTTVHDDDERAFLKHVGAHFSDPTFIRWLAADHTKIGDEMLAKALNKTNPDLDTKKVLTQLLKIDADAGDDPHKIADDLGYFLGLADVGGTKIDYTGVIDTLRDMAIDKAFEHLPGAGDVISIFRSLSEASAEAQQKFDTYGQNWSLETQHKVLAFMIYTTTKGAPPGFANYQAQHKGEPPDQVITDYVNDYLRDHTDDPKIAAAWNYLDRLQEQIGEKRRIGE